MVRSQAEVEITWLSGSGAVMISGSSGKNSSKIVPDLPPSSSEWLRTRIDPLCFTTISELTHKPNPVPVTSLVVKNGSKMCFRTAAVIPEPVSAT